MPSDRPSPSRLRRAIRASWPWLLLAGAFALWAFQGPSGETLQEGVPAPALRVPWSLGGDLDLEAERGHVVVLAFWATWCPACRQEGPVLSRVREQLEPRGDRVVGLSVDHGSVAAIGAAARRLGMTYPIAVVDREVADRFNVELLPTVYVIDPRGRITASFTGAVSEERLLAAVSAARGGGEQLSRR